MDNTAKAGFESYGNEKQWNIIKRQFYLNPDLQSGLFYYKVFI